MTSRSAWANRCEHLMWPPGEGTYRRAKPVARQVNRGVEMELQQGLGKLFDSSRVGEVQLVARAETVWLSASMVATREGPASENPHGFEIGILQRQTMEVGLFCVEAAVVLVFPARGGHGQARPSLGPA